ncbi:DUF5312 family protein [Treponema sp.]|uniref:DUF5312 family protein n=1 Tax=Treponema sp. TaxID=166 RepID=UPI0025DAEB1D|nr:DUF5312 family protein [Treponema sp.]MBR4323140.1 hypothetical protein [Treponema sp.]
MGFLRVLKELFESIFLSSSPEVKKRIEMRRIESELKILPSQILKNGLLQPNFAELIRVLYENSKPLDAILSNTINSEDIQRNGRFEFELIVTGFDAESQERIETLEYENRKQAIMESESPVNKLIEAQKRSMDGILKQLNTPGFIKIDETLSSLRQLADICHFNYINILHLFDQNFDGITSNSFGVVLAVSPAAIATLLQDLYYLLGNFHIDVAEENAVFALRQLLAGRKLTEEEKDGLAHNLKKINAIFTHYLTPEVIKKIIILGKNDNTLSFQFATYRSNSLKNFIDFMQKRFASDSERIKGEVKDYTVSFEIKELFGDRPLDQIRVYNSEMNEFLRVNTPYSFVWITPIQVIKTFLATFITSSVKTVLNNIVIEGFFNNQSYKAEFSSTIYAINEIDGLIDDFEKTFERGGKNDEAELRGLVHDSRTNADFLKKVGSMVDNINNQAHKLVQETTKVLYELYLQIGELILDAKKSKSDMVSNIKVLLTSARNHDGAGMIEQQYENWKLFLKIMKNYAIIGDIEKGHE